MTKSYIFKNDSSEFIFEDIMSYMKRNKDYEQTVQAKGCKDNVRLNQTSFKPTGQKN
jgi:hypothetical protein